MTSPHAALRSWRSAFSRTRAEPVAVLGDVLSHPYMLFLAICLAVWIPDGFNIGPANDGWRELGAEPMPLKPQLRYFGKIPRTLALHLYSGGFQSWEWMLLLVTLLRGILFYEIVRRLFPRQRVFAIACGLIALFHPAETVYFWMDSIGLDFDFVITLCACLAALVHLQTRSRESLLSMVFFQVVACFSYTAFLPLIFAFPIGMWLLRRVEGHKDKLAYLLFASLPTLCAIALQAWLAFRGSDREGALLSPHPHAILAGYLHEIRLFAPMFASVFMSAPSATGWMLVVAVPVLLAGFVASRAPVSEPAIAGSRSWVYYGVLTAGLLLLAALCYAPYAISNIRFGAQRQLLGAGLFVYMLLLMAVFLLFLPKLKLPRVELIILAALAAFVTLKGYENRREWVAAYRYDERFLAALATAVPAPRRGAVILVSLEEPSQQNKLAGLHHLRVNFSHALKYMYGDDTLSGAFLPFHLKPFRAAPGGVYISVAERNRGRRLIHVDSRRIIVADYSIDGSMTVRDEGWLREHTVDGAMLLPASAHRFSTVPGPGARTCSMFERPYRPAYCSEAVAGR